MKERPILFNAEMVRAILDGRKTQTRRVIKPNPDTFCGWTGVEGRGYWPADIEGDPAKCPYGQIGDRLWVREGFHAYQMDVKTGVDTHVRYSDGSTSLCFFGAQWPNKPIESDIPAKGFGMPSIYMPRRLSRITLEITDVRVQRLHDISEEDAQGEGIEKLPYPGGPNFFTYLADRVWHSAPTAKECFADLWDSINAKRCPWSSNPFVWAVSFKVVS